MTSALYAGDVTHVRLRPKRHALRYRLVQGLFDLDELPALGRRLRLFGHNRAAPISFHEADHGEGSGRLRDWVEGRLTAEGLEGPWGPIQVLCMPRMLGYVFNPLSVYFCHDRSGVWKAVVYEVNNTFGERHSYVLPVEGERDLARQNCDKAFYVSPFMQMDLRYDFRLGRVDERLLVEVRASDDQGPMLDARFVGARRALTDAALLRALAAYPLMTFKVMAAIHWEALKLWLKGVRLVPRAGAAPAMPEPLSS